MPPSLELTSKSKPPTPLMVPHKPKLLTTSSSSTTARSRVPESGGT